MCKPEQGYYQSTPKWVIDRENINNKQHEDIIFIGKMGVDGIVDGILPDGRQYTWRKHRKQIE